MIQCSMCARWPVVPSLCADKRPWQEGHRINAKRSMPSAASMLMRCHSPSRPLISHASIGAVVIENIIVPLVSKSIPHIQPVPASQPSGFSTKGAQVADGPAGSDQQVVAVGRKALGYGVSVNARIEPRPSGRRRHEGSARQELKSASRSNRGKDGSRGHTREARRPSRSRIRFRRAIHPLTWAARRSARHKARRRSAKRRRKGDPRRRCDPAQAHEEKIQSEQKP